MLDQPTPTILRKSVFIPFLLCSLLAGTLALVWIFANPSEVESAFALGLSKPRLVLAAVLLAPIIASLALLSACVISSRFCETIHCRLDEMLAGRGGLLPVSISLLFSFLLCLAGFLSVAFLPVSNYPSLSAQFDAHLPELHAYALRALPLLGYAAVQALLALTALIFQYRNLFCCKETWQTKTLLNTCLIWLVALLTLLHWAILVLRLELLYHIPGWSWWIEVKALSLRDAWFIIMLVLVLGTAWLVIRQPHARRRNLLLILVTAYAVQVGLGMVEGAGTESLRRRYFDSHHSAYARLASQSELGVLDSIRNYEELYSQSIFPSTKPPGVMAVYIGLERLVNGFAHAVDPEARYLNLTRTIAWGFPLLSLAGAALVWVLIELGARPPQREIARGIAPLFFLIAPNIVSFCLFLDQALYPALFVGSAMLIIFTFQRQSWKVGLFTGAFLYLAIFLTYSMLPLLAFCVIYAVLDFYLNRKERSRLRQVLLLTALAGGMLVLFLVFRFALNYDFLLRYQRAMLVVHNYDFYRRVGSAVESGIPLWARLQQVGAAAWLNNIDLACAVGVPVYVLFLVRSVKVTLAFLRRQSGHVEGIMGAFLGTFIALNLLAPMRGEAGRLWMYWVPMLAVFAAVEIADLVKRHPWVLSLILAAQWLTLVLTWHFQDLHM